MVFLRWHHRLEADDLLEAGGDQELGVACASAPSDALVALFRAPTPSGCIVSFVLSMLTTSDPDAQEVRDSELLEQTVEDVHALHGQVGALQWGGGCALRRGDGGYAAREATPARYVAAAAARRGGVVADRWWLADGGWWLTDRGWLVGGG